MASDRPIYKLSKSHPARKFLQKHANDPVIGGGFTSCLPYSSFTKVINLSRKAAAEAIQEALPYLSPKDRQLAELYLQMPPRKIAKRLGVRISILYDRLRALREKALQLVASRRTGYINQRDGQADLDSSPGHIARRTLKFTLHEETRYAYFVERDGDGFWVDEAGARFSDEIAEILSNAGEDLAGAEHLDCEEV